MLATTARENFAIASCKEIICVYISFVFTAGESDTDQTKGLRNGGTSERNFLCLYQNSPQRSRAILLLFNDTFSDFNSSFFHLFVFY